MTAANDPPRRRSRRALVFVTLAALVVTGSLPAYFWWNRTPTPQPPEINLAGAEPSVAHVIQKAVAAVREKPRSAEAWGRLGLVLRAHAYDDESDVCFAEAERFDPKDPRWPYLQGTHLRFRQPDAALPFVARAVQRCDKYAPHQTGPRLLLAEMLLAKGRYAEAEKEVQKVLERTPDDARANYDQGLVAFGRDDAEGCIYYLTRASVSPLTRKKAAAQLAMVYARQDDDKTAAEFNRRARELPDDLLWNDDYVNEYQDLEVGRQGRLKHAESLEQGDNISESIKVFQELLNEFPDEQSRVALGMTLLLKAGDAVAAEGVLRDAIRQAPGNMHAHYFLSLALYQQGDQLRRRGGDRDLALLKFREGAEEGRRAAAIKPDHAQSHLSRGLCQRELGERSAALASMRKAVRCRPEMAEAHYLLGETLADSGLDLEALAELQAALEMGRREPTVTDKARLQYLRVLVRVLLGAASFAS